MLRRRLVFVAAVIQRRVAEREPGAGLGTAPPGAALGDWVVVLDHEATPVTLKPHSSGFLVECSLGNGTIESDWWPGQPLFRAQLDGEAIEVQVEGQAPLWLLRHDGATRETLVLDPAAAARRAREGKAG